MSSRAPRQIKDMQLDSTDVIEALTTSVREQRSRDELQFLVRRFLPSCTASVTDILGTSVVSDDF